MQSTRSSPIPARQVVLLLGLLLFAFRSPAWGQHDTGGGAYATRQYRNLFAEVGHPQPAIQAKLDAAYEQLFHGDPADQTVFYPAGANERGPLAYLTDVANHDVRTEGMSYGMMLAVQTDHKRDFDALWNWANTYMLLSDPANPSAGFFAWSINLDGTPRAHSPAPDGEEYFVMSLYFAAHRWGSGKGLYDYQAQADRLLRLMRHHPVVPGPHGSGPMVDERYGMILFVPNAGGNTISDPSYHLPAFYELWARWGPPEDRAFWKRAAAVSRDYLARVTDPRTGLSPERANLDGSTLVGPDGKPMSFSYDSWRTASNAAVDFSWWREDPREQQRADRLQAFLHTQGIDAFADRYTLAGAPLSGPHGAGLLATTATASLAATPGPIEREFVEALWNAPVPAGQQRYYAGMLYLLSLLHCGGAFRIW